MKYTPLISVIMPCYNEQENIVNSIQCILKQTYKNFEFIIINDCSSDNSEELIKESAEKDNRIVYLKNESNLGVAKSLNHGLSIARGEYVARIDADDLCEIVRFQKQLEYFQSHPNCVLCGSYADVFDGKETYVQGNVRGNLKKHLVKNNPFVHSSIMFRRVINGIAVRYPDTKGFEDYGLWIELCEVGDFYIIPEVLVHRVDINNLETKKTWEGFNKIKVYKKLRTYQMKAIRKTGFWGYGLLCLAYTELKIIFSVIQNVIKKS